MENSVESVENPFGVPAEAFGFRITICNRSLGRRTAAPLPGARYLLEIGVKVWKKKSTARNKYRYWRDWILIDREGEIV